MQQQEALRTKAIIHMERCLLIAGGKIRCLRCTAHSSRSGQQCGRPALKVSKTQKCQFHGGRGSGPKTAEGRARIAAERTAHGKDTKSARSARSNALAKLSQLEDALHLLGMTSVGRSRGRKPNGYAQVKTVEGLRSMMIDDLLTRDKSANAPREK